MLSYFSWQIPTILSENQWCSKSSPERVTPLPSPAWQLIRVWTTWAWKHVPVELWPLVSSFLQAWSKASSSTTHKRPTRVAMCAQGDWGKSESDHMTISWQWNQVKGYKYMWVCAFLLPNTHQHWVTFVFLSFQCPSLLLWLRCRHPKEWFLPGVRSSPSRATQPTSTEIST